MPKSPFSNHTPIVTVKKAPCTCGTYRKKSELIHHTCQVHGPTHNGGNP